MGCHCEGRAGALVDASSVPACLIRCPGSQEPELEPERDPLDEAAEQAEAEGFMEHVEAEAEQAEVENEVLTQEALE